MGLALITLSVALAPARRLGEVAYPNGNPDCPCLTSAQRTAMTAWSKFENADGTTKVSLAGIDYSYPADYGINTCEVHDAGRDIRTARSRTHRSGAPNGGATLTRPTARTLCCSPPTLPVLA